MSQYNKTVLTRAGLELAKRANAGQAKFGITRAVTSADDWSHKTVQDLEEATTIPNIMQQGTIMDTNEVESNNSVIGVSLCFTNKNLSTGYQIKVIGLYVKEEGQENDFLYAVTTAITPEYMPSFADKVLYKFNMQMYLVIGNAQSVNVVINEGTAVTSTQFDKYKGEVADTLKKLENTHKEDMSHVAKSASVNGGAEILPNEAGKLELVVPDPDLSKYVSLEQLGELLKAKADTSTVNAQIADAKNTIKSNVDNLQSAVNAKASQADFDSLKTLVNNVKSFNVDSFKGSIPTTDINKITDSGLYGFTNQTLTNSPFSGNRWGLLFVLREYDNDANNIDQFITSNGNLYWRNISLANSIYPSWKRFANDGDINSLQSAINTKANASDVYTKKQVNDAFSTRDSNITDAANLAKQAQETANTKANASDVYTKSQTDGKLGQKITFVKCDSPQAAHDISTKPAADGSIVFGIYDMNDEPSEAYVAGQKINIEWLYNHLTDLQSIVSSGLATKANQSDLGSTNATVESQASEIALLKVQLNDAVNQINYIKANYIEGRRFAKSQEAQATAWENENPQRIAFITND